MCNSVLETIKRNKCTVFSHHELRNLKTLKTAHWQPTDHTLYESYLLFLKNMQIIRFNSWWKLLQWLCTQKKLIHHWKRPMRRFINNKWRSSPFEPTFKESTKWQNAFEFVAPTCILSACQWWLSSKSPLACAPLLSPETNTGKGHVGWWESNPCQVICGSWLLMRSRICLKTLPWRLLTAGCRVVSIFTELIWH